MKLNLPIPSLDAQQHSLRLQIYLKKIICEQKKISFHDFMKIALYEPGLGYYSAGSHKLGTGGDFVTAPEHTPLFGQTIAKSLLSIFPNNSSINWLELGAGTGKLAASILLYLAEQNSLPEHYFILEVSADLRQRQQETLKQKLHPKIFSKLTWLEQLPQHFKGIILGNELMDALPVHRFKIMAQGPKEYFLRLNQENHFEEYLDQPSSNYLTQRIEALSLAKGYSSEMNLQQEALLASLSDCLAKGIIFFIDYGFQEKEFYHPTRNRGTLMCHYQHRAHEDFLFWPGLQDITAHVDFTALAKSGLEHNLSLAHFTTQSAWLLHAGILELAQGLLNQFNTAEKIIFQQNLRQLISPEKMGDLFKVILFGKNMGSISLLPEHMDMRFQL